MPLAKCADCGSYVFTFPNGLCAPCINATGPIEGLNTYNSMFSSPIDTTYEASARRRKELEDPTSRMMGRLAPLVDEVLFELHETVECFVIEEAMSYVRGHFEARGKSMYAYLGYQGWSNLIRGRLTKLEFELVSTAGITGWRLK